MKIIIKADENIFTFDNVDIFDNGISENKEYYYIRGTLNKKQSKLVYLSPLQIMDNIYKIPVSIVNNFVSFNSHLMK